MIDEKIRISVRTLVEFVLRSGDIDNRRGTASAAAMNEGTRIHRMLQAKAGGDYRKEVFLRQDLTRDGICITLEGRADGIYTEEDGIPAIDEIKGMYLDVEALEESIPVHEAQAVCYAYMYSCENSLDGMHVRLTYCNLDSHEIKRFLKYYSFEQLESAMQSFLDGYIRWARFLLDHRNRMTAGVKTLEFPYPYREGQKELVVASYKAILRKTRLFLQAPTGIGKTLSVLFPAVKAMGENHAEKIFYLTAKTITRQAAEDAVRILNESQNTDLGISSVTITAKEKLCPFAKDHEGEGLPCNPEQCPYAKGHFDRVNDAVFALITSKDQVSREDILEYARDFEVCPFEMNLDVTNWTDLIICDYNYAFDPNVRLKRYFAEEQKGDYLFLVDEAHNLVERAREMYSCTLKKDSFLESSRKYKERSAMLSSKLKKCNQAMLALKRRESDYREFSAADLDELTLAVERLYDGLMKWNEEHPHEKMEDSEKDFFFSLRAYLQTYDLLDSSYRIWAEIDEKGEFLLHLYCVQPASNLRKCMDQGRASILFSATFLPIRYYKSLLSGEEDDYAIYARSPFEEEKRLLMVSTDVSAKYTRRTPESYERVADYLLQVSSVKPGNYLAFFPSYNYLEKIQGVLEERGSDLKLVVQSSGMDEEEKEDFLKSFSLSDVSAGEGEKALSVMTSELKTEPGQKTVLGLAVLGGVFSEGIDLTGDRLIGVFVVGTGIPGVCAERDILKDYFDKKGKSGFDYAYRFPGMNKVLQAAGRLIRTTEDTGIITLLDDRFLYREQQALFPREWEHVTAVSVHNAKGYALEFWNARGKGEEFE